MITKAIIQSINDTGTRCIVRMPLFESASSKNIVEAEALVNITPGMFNNLAVGDRVFISFEENEIDRPIILGKLFTGGAVERNTRGGGGVLDTLKVNSKAVLPASTVFTFPASGTNAYSNLDSPKKQADYIKWLERLTKNEIAKLEDNFTCFKNWTQWQLLQLDAQYMEYSSPCDRFPNVLGLQKRWHDPSKKSFHPVTLQNLFDQVLLLP